MIGDYEPPRHKSQLRSCIVELQEFERRLEPALPEGEEMADAYLAFLLERCSRAAGKVFVAEIDNAVVGFVGILTKIPPEEPDEDQSAYAYVTDLVVLPAYWRRGIGRALLEQAETFARSSGASILRVGVLAKNRVAGDLYRRLSFTEYQIQLIKRL